MSYIYFSLKIESVEFHFQDANFSVSSPFNKSEINEFIAQKLAESKFIPDLGSFNYLKKENLFYVEGLAYEESPPTDFNFIY